MDRKNQFLDLFISGRDTLTILGLVIGVVVWSFSYFQSKTDAVAVEKRLNGRIEAGEKKMDVMTEKLGRVSEDTQYIRGRLEPKN